jgi:SPP1 gp7 family putative phage head morphogenesis protein
MPHKTLHDQAIIHRIGLNRYSSSIVRKVLALLNRVDQDVVLQIAQADPKSAALLDRLLATVRAIQAEGWRQVTGVMDRTVSDLGLVELAFQQRLIGSIGGVSVQAALQSQQLTSFQLVAAVNARPFQGKFLRGWLDDAEEAAARRTREAIRQGFVESESIPQIVRRLRGTAANQYRDGTLEVSRRGAEAMVRTAITHTANVAAQETYKSAADYISGIEWVSTLDSRTSLICATRDGKVYPLDSGPRPPAHINCRSTTIPRLKGMKPIERTTYEAWLKDQPAEVQDDILGVAKAQLFRAGGVGLDRFVDRAGATLTIDQLKARDASAFKRAGL